MKRSTICMVLAAHSWLMAMLFVGCGAQPDSGADPQVTSRGTLEVTAELTEIRGDMPNRLNYNYAYVMKYKILDVHRGSLVPGSMIYVAHYNPLKPRGKVADSNVKDIGGKLTAFQVGNLHRMALESDIEEQYMGGIINKYFSETKDPIRWAVWTNRVVK